MTTAFDRRLRRVEGAMLAKTGTASIVIVKRPEEVPPPTSDGPRLVTIGVDVPGCVPSRATTVGG